MPCNTSKQNSDPDLSSKWTTIPNYGNQNGLLVRNVIVHKTETANVKFRMYLQGVDTDVPFVGLSQWYEFHRTAVCCCADRGWQLHSIMQNALEKPAVLFIILQSRNAFSQRNWFPMGACKGQPDVLGLSHEEMRHSCLTTSRDHVETCRQWVIFL